MTPQEREVMQMALDALVSAEKDAADFQRVNNDEIGDAITAIRTALATEQIECTPMPPVDDDGWCEWSYPKHKGYRLIL